jgi:hypothetical protein
MGTESGTAVALEQQQLQECPECHTELLGKYCYKCGENPPAAHDLSLRHFLHHGLHELTHLDSKVFRTLGTLIVKPGVLTADYLAGRRQRYVLPLRLFLVIFALYFFLYTRPGVALYDVRFIVKTGTRSGQINPLQHLLERQAFKKNLTTEAFFDRVNERWQHDVSFFQLGDVFFFAICLAMANWRRYFVEHLIFSLHTLSFTLLFGCLTWLYYEHYGLRQSGILIIASTLIYILYLFLGLPKVYSATGWQALLKSCFLVAGLMVSRTFFIFFTLVIAILQSIRGH